MSMNRHVKVNSSFSAGQKQKASAREQKVAFLSALSSDEIESLNKNGQRKLEKIASAFEGYEV